jgi:hypothetical protein
LGKFYIIIIINIDRKCTFYHFLTCQNDFFLLTFICEI